MRKEKLSDFYVAKTLVAAFKKTKCTLQSNAGKTKIKCHQIL